MLGWMKNTVRKSEAAVVVQQALQRVGVGAQSADVLSTKLVGLIWDWKPDLFEGKLGQRPHKMSIAAAALAEGVRRYPDGSEHQQSVCLALGAVLLDLSTNGPLYDLGGPDAWLIELADKAYVTYSEKYRPAQEAVWGGVGG